MQRMMILAICMLSATASFGQLNELQKAFFTAWNDEGIKAFYNKTSALKQPESIDQAYKGAAYAMYASQVSGVSKKLEYFKTGKANLEAAVKSNPANAEIRFLRFAVQSKAPFILGYYSELEGDANLIIGYLEKNKGKSGTTFWKKALTFMVDSGELSDAQEAKISKLKE